MKQATLIILLALLILPAAGPSYGGDYDDADARNEANTKLLRHRAQQYLTGNTRNRFLQDGSGDVNDPYNNSCGSVNIGNINNIDGTLREHIVIIDGDIINADNYCK